MSLSRCHASVIVPAIASAPVAAANRLALLDEITLVELTPGIGAVAQGPYMAKESCRGRSRRYNIPGDSELQTHRKPHELPRIYQILLCEGFGRPLICPPAEFLVGECNDEQTADT